MNAMAVRSERGLQMVASLNHLVETCINAEKGYALGAADVRAPALKAAMLRSAEARAAWIAALQRRIRELGGAPENEGTALGGLHRGWMGLRRAIEGRSDRLIVEECLLAEDWARRRYAKAMSELARAGWSAALKQLIEDQYAGVRVAQHDLGCALTAMVVA